MFLGEMAKVVSNRNWDWTIRSLFQPYDLVTCITDRSDQGAIHDESKAKEIKNCFSKLAKVKCIDQINLNDELIWRGNQIYPH
jgi:hypothetical protein